MSSSKAIENEVEDLDTFDQMDKSFHKVIAELIQDRTGDKFREEYEALHKALVQSHEHNKILIEKCRQINNDILSNANKISSVMQLSQNDQRTIAGLRHEFEKAWKAVEISQDREVKAKEVIDTLKDEISKLTRMVEQGGSMAMTQENSLQDVQDAIANLKKEISVQTAQIDSMRTEIENHSEGHKSNADESKRLKEELDSLQIELAESQKNDAKLSEESDRCLSTMKAMKAAITQQQQEIQQNQQNIQKNKAQNLSINSSLWEERRNLDSAVEDKEANLAQVGTASQVLRDKEKITEKTVQETEKVKEKIKASVKVTNELRGILNKVIKEVEEQTAENSWEKENRTKVLADKALLHNALSKCRKESFRLNSILSQKDLEVKGKRIDGDRAVRDLRVKEAQEGQEKLQTKDAEDRQLQVSNEILVLKEKIKQSREAIEKLDAEAEEYLVQGSNAKNSLIQIQEEVKIVGRDLDQSTLSLSEVRNDTKKQDALTEVVQNERDLSCRQYEESMVRNADLSKENEILIMQIKQLKDEIRLSDQKCVETHFNQKTLNVQLESLDRDAKGLKDTLKNSDIEATEFKNRIQRSLHLLSEAQSDLDQQRQVVGKFRTSSESIAHIIVSKEKKCLSLRKETELYADLIEKSSFAFKKCTKSLEEMRSFLMAEADKAEKIKSKSKHRKALRNEAVRMQKTLLEEKGKEKALEEELERPVNIHRWRFLDGTNPELAQMLRMDHTLHDRLMSAIYIAERLSNRRSEIAKKAENLQKHLQSSSGDKYDDEVAYLNEVLRVKTKQLAQLQSETSEQRECVSERCEQVKTVRGMIRDERFGLYEEKKKIIALRAKTATGGRKPLPPIKKDHKFIGGGFAVSGVLRNAATSQLEQAVPQLNLKKVSSVVTPRRRPTTKSEEKK